MAQVI